MRRTVFDSRDSRPQSGRGHRLRLDPDRGARMGEYATREPGEYTDSYYGPADDYSQRDFGARGYERANYGISPRTQAEVGPPARIRGHAEPTDHGHYGELHEGERSWASLGVSSTPEPTRSHRGRGPRGYTRSDDRLNEVICELLAEDPHVDASHVHVRVQDAVVTLTGRVEDRWTKYQIEELIDQCVGVRDIDNQLRVARADMPAS
jgi:hypothetical protein